MDPELENELPDSLTLKDENSTEMKDDVQTAAAVNNVQSTPQKTIPNLLKSIDLHGTIFCMPTPQPAFSDTSSVLSPASSSENNNEPLNLSTDVEFTDSESENIRQPFCHNSVTGSYNSGSVTGSYNSGGVTGSYVSTQLHNTALTSMSGTTTVNPTCTTKAASTAYKQLPNFSPQRILPPMSPLQGGMSPTRSTLPEGFRDNLSAMLPNQQLPTQQAVRVKVRSRHASFSTPPKSPADTQWRLFKVNKDMKEESFDDINGERNFTQGLQLKNHCDTKLNVSDKEEEASSCPSSPRHISSPRGTITAVSPRHIPHTVAPARPLPGRSTTPSPSPPFTTPGPSIPARCVSPGPVRPNSFTLKRKMVEECASPPKRPCTMGLGHRSPTVEYRARNNSPAPLSPLAVSSHSVPEGQEVVRTVPLHLLDKIEITPDRTLFNEESDSSDSSDVTPPRSNRQPG